MKSSLARYFFYGLCFAFFLGILSFFALRTFNESSSADFRKRYLSFLVQSIEHDSFIERGHHAPGTNIWILGEDGQVIATHSGFAKPEVEWNELKKPSEIHEHTFHYRWFQVVPDFILLRLDTKPNSYLLVELKRQGSFDSNLWGQITIILLMIAVATLVALFWIYFYLKQKSAEARIILSKLGKGDLKARFEISRFDEIGSLMNDFNRMASEIEHLVLRIQEAETARTNLLEELGHDIRTPLTSLRTSIETLDEHFQEMPDEEKIQFIGMIRSEFSYFIQLIDGLLFMAHLTEPRYKKTAKKIQLSLMIKDEIARRKMKSPIQFIFHHEQSPPHDGCILGDPLLIQRLLNNALDNSSRYAQSKIQLSLQKVGVNLLLLIEDDGPGMSDEAIENFGQRRKHRPLLSASEQQVSLGLGSIIMKSILKLHGGNLHIERLAPGNGTRFIFSFPIET